MNDQHSQIDSLKSPYVEMNHKEEGIYLGLKSIGSEIAAHFKDAVYITKHNFESKPYILAHLSREIEGGLRDILAPKNNTRVIRCKTCNRPTNQGGGHKESILKALGINEETEIAKKWFETAKSFHRYAHRRGAWKEPREIHVFNMLWEDFVNILEFLIGNYFAIADRMDSILNNEEPTPEIMGSLTNLLKLESRYVYFFQHLEHSEWLDSLYKNGYFKGEQNKANWYAAISGYYSNNTHPSDNLFNIFVDKGHFTAAFNESETLSKDVVERIVHHILIGYLSPSIKLGLDDDPLQALLFNKSKVNYQNIIHFFYDKNRVFPKADLLFIKQIWMCIVNRVIDSDNPSNDGFIISGCSKWIINFPQIDKEIYDLLIFSAKYIKDIDRYSLFEELEKHVNDSPEKQGIS